MTANRERLSEMHARAVVERALKTTLNRVVSDPSGPPSPDYRVAAPAAAFEVKEFTSQDWRDVRAAVDKSRTHVASPRLEGVWGCLLPTYNAEQEMALGKPGSARQPKVKRLAKDLVGPLEVLECQEISDYRYGLNASSPELRQACERISWLLRGGECHRVGGESPFPPGVLLLGVGWERGASEDPDVFADLLQTWLDQRSSNMRASLAGERGVRHGVLVVEEAMVGEARSIGEEGRERAPARPLCLPAEIDVFWVVIGPRWLRFDGHLDSWSVNSSDARGDAVI
ncbi:hypothetical protein [Nocardia tengchongensis]|uniref:hypothetical protein n=1 Tax=Nocardia tengchongensis TaxID=2055889 RepID=UPI0036623552